MWRTNDKNDNTKFKFFIHRPVYEDGEWTVDPKYKNNIERGMPEMIHVDKYLFLSSNLTDINKFADILSDFYYTSSEYLEDY